MTTIEDVRTGDTFTLDDDTYTAAGDAASWFNVRVAVAVNNGAQVVSATFGYPVDIERKGTE